MNLNIDYHELEGIHLKEIEDNFKNGILSFSENLRSPMCDFNNNGNLVNRSYSSRLI